MSYDFSKMEKFTKNQITSIRKYLVANYDRYMKSIEQRINFDYLFCTACEEIESEDLVNEIFICDMCTTQVHQRCYGGNLLDFADKTNNWYCERCLFLIEAYKKKTKGQISIACALCPETNQMLRHVTVTDQAQNEEKFWVHLSCLRRVPTIQALNQNGDVFTVDQIKLLQTSNQHNCRCFYCKQNFGLLQDCAYKGCDKYYHIGCFKARGLLIHQQGMQMIRELLKEKSKILNERNIYCIEHIRAHINALTLQIGEEQVDDVINQTIIVMEYRWDKWYQWNFSKADRYRPRQKVKVPLPPQEAIVLQLPKPRQTRNSQKIQTTNTPYDVTPAPETNNTEIEENTKDNKKNKVTVNDEKKQDENFIQILYVNEEKQNSHQNMDLDEEIQNEEEQNLNQDQAQEIKNQKLKNKNKYKKRNKKSQKKVLQSLNPFTYEIEENNPIIDQDQNPNGTEDLQQKVKDVQLQIYVKILNAQREILNRKIMELIEIYKESSPEQYYQLKEILEQTSVLQCLEMYQQVQRAQYLQSPDEVSELQDQPQDTSQLQMSESKKPRTRHLQIKPQEEQKLPKKSKKQYIKKKKPLIPIIEKQNENGEDQKSQSKSSQDKPDYKPDQEVQVENIAKQLLNLQQKRRGRAKFYEDNQQQNPETQEILENQQVKKEKIVKAPKAKLIQAYQQNLTDEDIITQIENLSIKENQLNTTIPKKYRTLRKVYEDNLRKSLLNKLRKIQKVFVEQNKNPDFETQQIYGRIDISVCKMLFNEYHDIYNIEAFDNYVWGYMFFSGLLDSNNKQLDLSLENTISDFWKKKCDIMNLDHDCDVVEFIFELRQTFIKMVSKINEEMKQKQQLDNIFLQAKETLLVE